MRLRPHFARTSTSILALCAMLVAAFFVLGMRDPKPARAVADPKLVWKTIESDRFIITYPEQVEAVAQRIAAIGEHAHKILAPVLGWEPKEKCQILLTDDTDSANGSATSLPYNTIRLYVTAPDDLSALADYDDWYTELVTHEYTHILHTDHITGLPAIYDAIFGKVYSPNQMQPRWILEGLAVLEESKFTAGGRERASTFDMFLRADVLEDNIAPLDQVSHTPRRWPQGNLWYLYGSHFLEWIQDKYGADALKQVAEDYGRQIVPYGINRAIFRATGKTYVELYEDWKVFLKDRYGKQKSGVEAIGLREGKRLTVHGENSFHPRYAPKSEPGTARRIVYNKDDGHSPAGLWALDLKEGIASAPPKWMEGPMIARSSGSSSANFLPNGDLFYDSIEVSQNVYFLWDLFRLPVSSFGTEAVQGTRLTTGLRSTEPAVSPDGRRVVFTINGKGTISLAIADVDIDGAGTFGPVRELLHSTTYDQVYTPRWSPDGKTVVFSAWHAGGYRDIQTIDVATRVVKDITHDRALDTGPVYSPDGSTIYFSSDRTGIANLYAYDVATGALKQVTNVVEGAYQPDVSSDGKHLAYVGYTHLGYDIFELDLDRATWLDAQPYVDARPPPSQPPPTLGLVPRDYNPLPTLRPHTWSIASQPDAFGQAVSVTTTSTDLVGHHSIALTGTLSLGNGQPGIDAAYTYGRLPFDIRVHGFRSVGLAGGYRFSDQTPSWTEQTIGGDVGINYPYSTSFWSHSFAASYSFQQFRPLDVLPRTYDPYAQPTIYPQSGVVGSIHLGYAWSNVQSFLWSVGGERGFSFSATLDVARRALGSDFDLVVAGYSAAGYFPMPWGHHHVLALHAQGAAMLGDYDQRGAFGVGGFQVIPIADALRSLVEQGSIALRGYKPNQFVGDGYQLFNAEYRFPIVNVDHGIETLPIFIERLYGDVFADYGYASFDTLDLLHMKLGVGAELLIDFTVGYFVDLTLRLGLANGMSNGGTTQVYGALSAPF